MTSNHLQYLQFPKLKVTISLLSLIYCFMFLPTIATADHIGLLWVETVTDKANLATFADFHGNGDSDLVIASTDQLSVYQWDPQTSNYIHSFTLSNFSAPLASLASADTYSDGMEELWVGTEGSGAIYIYKLEKNSLEMLCLVGRLWGIVAKMIPLDINKDDKTDLLALNTEGQAFLFLNRGNYSFTQIWRTPFNTSPDHYISQADLDGDGFLEIVIGKKEGYFAVYKWEFDQQELEEDSSGRLIKIAENYPWGAIEFVDVVDIDNNNKIDILIGTGLNRLYGYAWNGSSFSIEWQWPFENKSNPEILQYDLNNTRPILIDIEDEKLKIYTPESNNQQVRWESTIPARTYIQSNRGIITFSLGQVAVYGPVDQDYIFIQNAKERYLLKYLPIIQDETLYLDWNDWKDLLGLRLWVSQEGTRLSGVGPGFQLYSLQAGQDSIWLNGRRLTLEHTPMMVDGRLYLPIEFPLALGFGLEWNYILRALFIK